MAKKEKMICAYAKWCKSPDKYYCQHARPHYYNSDCDEKCDYNKHGTVCISRKKKIAYCQTIGCGAILPKEATKQMKFCELCKMKRARAAAKRSIKAAREEAKQHGKLN